MARIKIHARVFDEVDPREFAVSGQNAKCLVALVAAGSDGVTAQECGGWAYRLAAYCHDLQRKHGLVIETQREPHPGGWHGRHVLHTHVEILTDDPPSAAPAQREAA